MGKIAPALDRIRALNDTLRQTGTGGKVLVTAAFDALDPEKQFQIMRAVQLFDDFTEDNDPYGEHDCVIVFWNGYRVLFKIDYYDKTLTYQSEDPAGNKKTCRVMTVMFLEEHRSLAPAPSGAFLAGWQSRLRKIAVDETG